MRRNSRGHEGNNNKVSMFILGGIVLAVIIAFVLAYTLYSGNLSKQAKGSTNNTQRISATESNMLNMMTNSENSQTVSSTIGKSVNEMKNETATNQNTDTNSNTTKMAVNTSNIEKNKKEEKHNSNEENNNIMKNKTSENTVDPTFVKPVEGEKIKEYSKDNLVYSNTLEEWTTHLGIDYASQKTDVVKASADGKIKSIKNDPRYGLTVVIEHNNGFESVYSSLLTAEFVSVGEEVKQGQTIATVGNTATFEIADETHLHFEIKKDGNNVDPNIYIR